MLGRGITFTGIFVSSMMTKSFVVFRLAQIKDDGIVFGLQQSFILVVGARKTANDKFRHSQTVFDAITNQVVVFN